MSQGTGDDWIPTRHYGKIVHSLVRNSTGIVLIAPRPAPAGCRAAPRLIEEIDCKPRGGRAPAQRAFKVEPSSDRAHMGAAQMIITARDLPLFKYVFMLSRLDLCVQYLGISLRSHVSHLPVALPHGAGVFGTGPRRVGCVCWYFLSSASCWGCRLCSHGPLG